MAIIKGVDFIRKTDLQPGDAVAYHHNGLDRKHYQGTAYLLELTDDPQSGFTKAQLVVIGTDGTISRIDKAHAEHVYEDESAVPVDPEFLRDLLRSEFQQGDRVWIDVTRPETRKTFVRGVVTSAFDEIKVRPDPVAGAMQPEIETTADKVTRKAGPLRPRGHGYGSES